MTGGAQDVLHDYARVWCYYLPHLQHLACRAILTILAHYRTMLALLSHLCVAHRLRVGLDVPHSSAVTCMMTIKEVAYTQMLPHGATLAKHGTEQLTMAT
eukprot:jgi/Ulvmu1/8112/UM040_0007.1